MAICFKLFSVVFENPFSCAYLNNLKRIVFCICTETVLLCYVPIMWIVMFVVTLGFDMLLCNMFEIIQYGFENSFSCAYLNYLKHIVFLH